MAYEFEVLKGDVVNGSSYPYTSSSKYPKSKQNQDNSIISEQILLAVNVSGLLVK